MALIDVNWNPPARDLRIFAVLELLFFGLVAWAIQHRSGSGTVAAAVVVVAALVCLVGLIRPAWVRPVYVVWMAAALPIGWVVSHLLMAAIFYLVVTPIGLIMRLCGRDPMQRKLDSTAASYWQKRPRVEGTRRYFRQF